MRLELGELARLDAERVGPSPKVIGGGDRVRVRHGWMAGQLVTVQGWDWACRQVYAVDELGELCAFIAGDLGLVWAGQEKGPPDRSSGPRSVLGLIPGLAERQGGQEDRPAAPGGQVVSYRGEPAPALPGELAFPGEAAFDLDAEGRAVVLRQDEPE